MDKSDVLLGIIDDRCRKALKEANIPSKIVGTVVKVDSKNKKIDVFLSNSFGFGGTNSALILRKFDE